MVILSSGTFLVKAEKSYTIITQYTYSNKFSFVMVIGAYNTLHNAGICLIMMTTHKQSCITNVGVFFICLPITHTHSICVSLLCSLSHFLSLSQFLSLSLNSLLRTQARLHTYTFDFFLLLSYFSVIPSLRPHRYNMNEMWSRLLIPI